MPPRLTPPAVIPASLEPLKASAEYDDLEAELKAAFVEVFEAMLRPGLQRVNSYGVPHRGTFPTVERFVKADGLAMERKTAAEAFMAELYRAWRARNPRRGTAFLRYYLQLLWPGQWTLVQQWQDSALPYPTSLHDTYAPGRFLTSRLRLTLALEDDDSGILVSKLSGSFRAVLPARMLLDVALTAPLATQGMRAANWADDCEWEDFEGVAAIDPAVLTSLTLTAPSPASGTVGIAASGGTVSNGGAVAANFALSSTLGATMAPASGTVAAGASVPYTITPVAAGVHAITLANTSGGTVAGSPASYTATAAVTDPMAAFVALRLEFEGASIVDTSTHAAAMTVSGTATQTTDRAKMGSKSLRPGATGYVTTPSHARYKVTGDWGIQCWLWCASESPSFQRAWGSSVGPSSELAFISGDAYVIWRANVRFTVSAFFAGLANTWVHVYLAMVGGVLTLYRNGVAVGTWTNTAGYPAAATDNMTVGAGASGNQPWQSDLDQFEYTVGGARWTAPFTPPASGWMSPP